MSESEVTEQPVGAPRDPLSVETVLAIMVEQMASMAWQKMGLQPDPVTGTIEANHAEAKLAIDVCSSLTGFLLPSLDESDRRRIESLMRDLKINFVQSQGGNS